MTPEKCSGQVWRMTQDLLFLTLDSETRHRPGNVAVKVRKRRYFLCLKQAEIKRMR